MRSTQDFNVLITGAGRGIGKRLAIGLSGAKAKVALLGRSQAELDLTKLEIEDNGGIALRLRADVRNYDQVTAAVDRMNTSRLCWDCHRGITHKKTGSILTR